MSSKKNLDVVNVDEDEGLLALRHYELEAYAAAVTALRAEGGFTAEKKETLKQLRTIFGISKERHKAEIRRAINDDKLSAIATQIHGDPYEQDWIIEGRRLFGVLKRPTPITAYTKIADEIALQLWKENNAITNEDKASKQKEGLKIFPPKNPRDQLYKHVFEEVNNLIDAASDTAEENQSLEDGEDKGTSASKDNSDCYVYLPSGSVVQLEPKKEQGDPTPAFEPEAGGGLPKKKRKISIQDEEPLYSIKKVFKQEDIHKAKLQASQRVESQPREYKPPQQSVPFSSRISDHPPPPTRPRARSPVPVRTKQIHSRRHTEPKLGKPTLHQTPVPPEHLYATSASNRSYHSRSSWATKHNSASEGRNKRKQQRPLPPMPSRKLSKSMPGPSRYGLWSSDKRSRVLSAKDASSFQYNSSMMEQSRMRSQKTHVTSSRPKPSSMRSPSDMRPLSLDDSLFSQVSEQQRSALSPQRVFRPTLNMSHPSMVKKSPLILPDSAMIKKNPLPFQDIPISLSTSSHLQHCSLESGLAPVSTIVSQVAAQAELPSSTSQQSSGDQRSRLFSAIGKVKIVRPAAPKQTTQLAKPSTSVATYHSLDANLLPNPETPEKYSRHSDLLSISPPLGPLRSPMYDSPKEIKRIIQPIAPISPFPMRPPPSTLSNVRTLNDPERRDGGAQAPRADDPNIPTSVESQSPSKEHILKADSLPENVTAAASGLCALASTPVIPVSMSTSKSLPTVKPSSVQISSANIIKVTPRPFSVSKSLPVVSRISGTTRITKTLTSVPGSTKPSIIVVHRQQGRRSVTTTPAKFLEIESSGKQLPRVKTVTCTSRSLNKTPTTIIKPATAKLLDTSANLRPVSGDNVPMSAGIHKVITKGKMRQLVLKPTTSNPTSQILHPSLSSTAMHYTSASKPPLEKEILTALSMESLERSKSTASLHATSTMKALMAIQKSAPPLTTNATSNLPRGGGSLESMAESTFSHSVGSKPVFSLVEPMKLNPSPSLQGYARPTSGTKPADDLSSYKFADDS